MKKILVAILFVCLVFPIFATTSLAGNREDHPAPVTIEEDSVLVLTTDEQNIDDVTLEIPTSLEYQQVVFPAGTDLSQIKFHISVDGLKFSMSEDLMTFHGIRAAYLEGYFLRLREDFLKNGVQYAKDGGTYELVPEEGLILEEGATYTISIDGNYRVRRQSIYDVGALDAEWKRRWLAINQSRKFAFTVSVADPVITEGETHEMPEGTDKSLTIKTNYDLAKFVGVEYNGTMLTKDKDYTVASENATITLNGSFIKTLETGTHAIKLLFQDEISLVAKVHVTERTVDAQKTSGVATKVPATGDVAAGGIALAMLLGSAATFVGVSKKRKYD